MMEKYFEALERLAMPDDLHISECEKLGIGLTEDFDLVEQALLELTSIKEAKPSEALKDLEILKSHISARDMLSETNKKIALDICNDIKQALLKAQEQKHYLNWEDLEFKEEKQTMLVLLNEEKYILNYHRTINKTFCYNRCFVQLIRLDVIGANITIANSYFFNDLHLERVEE